MWAPVRRAARSPTGFLLIPHVRVLVLEAGGWDRHPFVKLPLTWGRVLLDRIYDWGYDGEPQDTMAGRRIECARGKVIGGSSTINAMAYVRGNRGDYARWASYGLSDWSYDDVLPYFRKQESWEGGASVYRGGDGPLQTRKSQYQDPLVDAYLQAAAGSGYALNDDYNGEKQDGFARMQMTIRRGWRDSAATAYLHPVLARSNLIVQIRARVTRILMEGTRVTGVAYLQDGRRIAVRADREVILCGGAINSPQVLMLSGIGDPQALRTHGIAVQVPLPGVGRNLQDHPAALLVYARGDKSPLLRNMRVDRVALGLIDAFARRARIHDGSARRHHRLREKRYGPSAAGHPALVHRRFAAGGALSAAVPQTVCRQFRLPRCAAAPAEPRRHYACAHRDPLAPTAHQPRSAVDGGRLDGAAQWHRAVSRHRPPPGAEAIHRSRARARPGSDRPTPSSRITCDAPRSPRIIPAGTCKMGVVSDAMAVVDDELCVRGVERLRVVDASVFPDLVGGNINATMIMIAERAADLILRAAA